MTDVELFIFVLVLIFSLCTFMLNDLNETPSLFDENPHYKLLATYDHEGDLTSTYWVSKEELYIISL